MHLSDLQKYVLKQVYISGPQCPRSAFAAFYKQPREKEIKIITRSLERLIAKGLIVGFGYKTAEKLFLQKVSLTPKGRRMAKQIAREQQRLPLPATPRQRRGSATAGPRVRKRVPR